MQTYKVTVTYELNIAMSEYSHDFASLPEQRERVIEEVKELVHNGLQYVGNEWRAAGKLDLSIKPTEDKPELSWKLRLSDVAMVTRDLCLTKHDVTGPLSMDAFNKAKETK